MVHSVKGWRKDGVWESESKTRSRKTPDRLSGNHRPHRAAAPSVTMEGRVFRQRERGVFIEGPIEIRVDERDVSRGAGGECAAVELEERGGLGSVECDQAREVDGAALVDEDVVEGGELGFEPGDAERGMVDFDLLLVGGVRGVVAAKDRERAVGDALDDVLDVLRSAEGRVHFEIAVERGEFGIGERDVVRADLAGNFHAARSRRADKSHTASGADVLAVDGRVEEFGEKDVAGDDHFLAGARPAGKAEAEAPLALVHDAIADQ